MFHSIKYAAKELNISERFLRKLVAENRIFFYRLSARTLRVDLDELRNFMRLIAKFGGPTSDVLSRQPKNLLIGQKSKPCGASAKPRKPGAGSKLRIRRRRFGRRRNRLLTITHISLGRALRRMGYAFTMALLRFLCSMGRSQGQTLRTRLSFVA